MKPSRLIGPEDVRVGDYVTCAERTYDLVPPMCDFIGEDRRVEPIHITVFPYDAGQPLCVMSVCLPYVLVRDVHGLIESVDLRQVRLAKLNKAYGKAAFKKSKGKTK